MHNSFKVFDFLHIQTADIVEFLLALNKQLISNLKIIQNILMTFDEFTCWLSSERKLPFGLAFINFEPILDLCRPIERLHLNVLH